MALVASLQQAQDRLVYPGPQNDEENCKVEDLYEKIT
jgi:hypothetical protein